MRTTHTSTRPLADSAPSTCCPRPLPPYVLAAGCQNIYSYRTRTKQTKIESEPFWASFNPATCSLYVFSASIRQKNIAWTLQSAFWKDFMFIILSLCVVTWGKRIWTLLRGFRTSLRPTLYVICFVELLYQQTVTKLQCRFPTSLYLKIRREYFYK